MSENSNKKDISNFKTIHAHAAAAALEGKILDDRYEIEELIGEGAMGYVYRGRQLRLKRSVAIKIPKSEFLSDPDFMSRFEREALNMARCVHENIVSIYDVYVARNPGETSYIVMEMVKGTELHRFLTIQENDLTITALIDILGQLARGLDAAHAAGIVHRDIKPSNMIVTQPERVAKIMDFGIARGEADNAFRTQAGMATGTPAYMSPEQILGKEIGPAADIYAFAVSLYRIFARNLPFNANNATAFLVAHTKDKPIPLKERNSSWPESLGKALLRSIEKNPEKRHPSATSLVEDIKKALVPVESRALSSFFSDTESPGKKSLFTLSLSRIIFILSGIIILIAIGIYISGTKGKETKKEIQNTEITAQIQETGSEIPEAQTSTVKEKILPVIPVKTEIDLISKETEDVENDSEEIIPEEYPDKIEEDSFSNDYIWGPEFKAAEAYIEITKIDKIFVEKIRRSIFRDDFEKAAIVFSRVDKASRDEFFKGLEDAKEKYTNLTIKYKRMSVRTDGKRAVVLYETGITGKKLGSRGRRKPEVIIKTIETTAMFEKDGKEWFLIEWPRYF
jgi:serine/threonine protein kinase